VVGECDLAIIIGTSLKVNPFAYLAQIIPSSTPVVLINRDDVMEGRNRKLWLKGDIE
jgi:NAD-dependent SIR2 family protein deacetylase